MREGNETSAPVVTITFCGYPPRERFWAFNKMGSARGALARVGGLRFWKLLGTGQGRGFSLKPDWSRYGLLAVWEDAGRADEFFYSSRLMREYRHHAQEIWTVRLLTIASHGAWSGANPFQPATEPQARGPVAVLTRATIRLSKVAAFWRAVPATTRALDCAEGLIASVGTGEAPFIRPATFSIWRGKADLQRFAYQAAEHAEVIRRRREGLWYTEELFARFAVVSSEGAWNGRDPLSEVADHYRA